MRRLDPLPIAGRAPPMLWSELAPGAHVVQLYDGEAALIDSLDEFTCSGLMLEESVVVIATTPHIAALRMRLRERGLDLAMLQLRDAFIAIDADELLARFMTSQGPDIARFDEIVTGLLSRARAQGRGVRAFGEMVALLWARGEQDAALQLEASWQRHCERERLPLLCAYPKRLFDCGDEAGIRDVCAAHASMVIA